MTTNKNTIRRTKIGEVCVDTGSLVICDPCNLAEMTAKLDVETCIKMIGNKGKDFGVVQDRTGKVTTWGKNAPMGIISRAGLGDGFYPVYAITDELGGWGRRVMALEIDLSPTKPQIAYLKSLRHKTMQNDKKAYKGRRQRV